ncbi:hypothetical protein RvY_04461 [Ramazzottius varieornatus]|uniref:Uncharacterized protein n=1 Tax=Ramazzottius varieornatus TaxID=947166 RepID=A0A1D1UV98_RAMVA|nr:hypothetical protein RvY_04461 [Ramazzottius varieornatus]
MNGTSQPAVKEDFLVPDDSKSERMSRSSAMSDIADLLKEAMGSSEKLTLTAGGLKALEDQFRQQDLEEKAQATPLVKTGICAMRLRQSDMHNLGRKPDVAVIFGDSDSGTPQNSTGSVSVFEQHRLR